MKGNPSEEYNTQANPAKVETLKSLKRDVIHEVLTTALTSLVGNFQVGGALASSEASPPTTIISTSEVALKTWRSTLSLPAPPKVYRITIEHFIRPGYLGGICDVYIARVQNGYDVNSLEASKQNNGVYPLS